MRFLTVREAQEIPAQATFRESRLVRGFLYLVHFYVFLLLLFSMIEEARDWRFLLNAFFFALLLTTIFIGALKTFRRGNWLLRLTREGILVKIPSFQSDRSGGRQLEAVLIDPREVEWIEKTRVATKFIGIEDVHGIYLDVVLKGGDLGALAQRIDAISRRELHRPPVSWVDGRILRLCWSGPDSHILPGIGKALRILSAVVPVKGEDGEDDEEVRYEGE